MAAGASSQSLVMEDEGSAAAAAEMVRIVGYPAPADDASGLTAGGAALGTDGTAGTGGVLVSAIGVLASAGGVLVPAGTVTYAVR